MQSIFVDLQNNYKIENSVTEIPSVTEDIVNKVDKINLSGDNLAEKLIHIKYKNQIIFNYLTIQKIDPSLSVRIYLMLDNAGQLPKVTDGAIEELRKETLSEPSNPLYILLKKIEPNKEVLSYLLNYLNKNQQVTINFYDAAYIYSLLHKQAELNYKKVN